MEERVLKLNLGSGDKLIDGYINLDGKFGDSLYPLEYTDCDVIRSSHLIEHFGHEESVKVLCHWYDCLKVGGVLMVATVDFDDLIRRRNLGQQLDYEGIIMGGQSDERDYHKSIWNTDKLVAILSGIGFTDLCTWQSEIADCASFPFSLNIQGTKP
jgi:SAM-dependent methyltransferase